MALTEQDMATITQLIRDEIEPLRAEIDRVDEWANGLFQALEDVLRPLLKANPALVQEIEPLWCRAAQQYEQLQQGLLLYTDEQPTLERLEGRKILYRTLQRLHVFPPPPG